MSSEAPSKTLAHLTTLLLPQITTLLLPVSREEFLGRSGASDQVIYRERQKGMVYAKVLDAEQNFFWTHCSFADLAEYGAHHSWDGTIYLYYDYGGELFGEKAISADTQYQKFLETLNNIRSLSQQLQKLATSPIPLLDYEKREQAKIFAQISELVQSVDAFLAEGISDYEWGRNKLSHFLQQQDDAKCKNALEQMRAWTMRSSWDRYYEFFIFSNGGRSNKDVRVLKTKVDQFRLNCLASLYNELGSLLKNAPQLPLTREGRAVVCSAFEGTKVSITIRGDSLAKILDLKGDTLSLDTSLNKSEWKPGDPKKNKPEHLFEFDDYVAVIAHQLFEANNGKISRPLAGLIVIMGETGCGKSNIAYKLMHHYLRCWKEGGTREFCHVVTLEDPIEIRFYKDRTYPGSANKTTTPDFAIHYTARHKILDCTLKSGLGDALRQKPTVLYAGEIRLEDDWRATLDFAATGHLVIATAHAGLLSESLGKLLHACNANTPARRGEEADKILGLVHLSPQNLERVNANLMTIWRRTHGGANSLISEGLSSVVPYNGAQRGTLGAQFLMEELKAKRQARLHLPANATPPAFQKFLTEACKRDLSGI